ncbi:MAG: hypothetical protein ABIH66_03665, partial [bacterium]
VSSVVPVLLYRSAYREQTLISSEKKTVHGSPDGQEGFETASGDPALLRVIFKKYNLKLTCKISG